MNNTGSFYEEVLCEKMGLSNLNECEYFPKFFTIETCDDCNARCIMCPKGGEEKKLEKRLMSEELFSRILEEIRPYVDWIQMICLNSDGEPLLDQTISKKIKLLKDAGVRHVNISTNGSLLTVNRIREILDSNLDDIRISLDGLKRETYERIRGLNYQTVFENVHNLIKMRNERKSSMSIRLRMVKMEENKDEWTDWLEYWSGFLPSENDKVQLMPMHTWSGTVADESASNISYYADKPCISPFSSMTINYDGGVQLCDSDILQREIVGDACKSSLKEIWNGEKFAQIRNWHRNSGRNNIPICRGCDHWSRIFQEK